MYRSTFELWLSELPWGWQIVAMTLVAGGITAAIVGCLMVLCFVILPAVG